MAQKSSLIPNRCNPNKQSAPGKLNPVTDSISVKLLYLQLHIYLADGYSVSHTHLEARTRLEPMLNIMPRTAMEHCAIPSIQYPRLCSSWLPDSSKSGQSTVALKPSSVMVASTISCVIYSDFGLLRH